MREKLSNYFPSKMFETELENNNIDAFWSYDNKDGDIEKPQSANFCCRHAKKKNSKSLTFGKLGSQDSEQQQQQQQSHSTSDGAEHNDQEYDGFEDEDRYVYKQERDNLLQDLAIDH